MRKSEDKDKNILTRPHIPFNKFEWIWPKFHSSIIITIVVYVSEIFLLKWSRVVDSQMPVLKCL